MIITTILLALENKAAENSVPHVSFYDPKYYEDVNYNANKNNGTRYEKFIATEQRIKINDFYRFLSVCHEAVPGFL